MADKDDNVLTTSNVKPENKPRRYGTAAAYTTKKKGYITESHDSIDQQTEAFVKSGKKIQKIPHGVSGMPELQSGERRHIHIGNKYKTA